ncbi:lipoxygenase 1 [Actinidia rufa]|uniref:Lipoxygenase 1 n=1 Tax=Actinidia rufa TaxID=165716 RepID=A0A7J0EZS7_9ERIC|nr:lipoxygenase 1 [Actinidia rufa]
MDPITDENMNKKTKHEVGEIKKIQGTVVLMKKKFLDSNDLTASVTDRFDEILGNKVSLQLISAVNEKELRGKLGKPANLEDWDTKITALTAPEDKSAWRTDEEFAREMLAGINPVVICRLQEFPPNSKLNPQVYNNEASSKTKECIEKNLEGLTIDEALNNKKLFTLDYHDILMPYLRRINSTSTKIYATRTLLFLKK